jgi:CHAT domain-containing protein
VASLWPLGDEAGAALFAAFYRELGQGRSVSEALRRAQSRRLEAGAPAFDWAGVVVLGDGNLVPVQGGTRSERHPAAWAGGVALLVVAGAWAGLRRRERARLRAL